MAITADPPAKRPESWRASIQQTLERWVATPRFRRFAAAFPLMRPVARHRSRVLLDMMAGFVYTQVLLACTRLDLPNKLLGRSLDLDELVVETGLQRDALYRLVRAAVALDILREKGAGRYGLGGVGRDLANNDAALSMIEHHVALYADLRDPLALLRGEIDQTAMNAIWPYVDDPAGFGQDTADEYSTIMSRSQEGVAEEVLDDYAVRGKRHILDIGGGDGTFLSAVAARAAADTRLTLFDLPQVARTASQRLEARGLGHRITAVGGSFKTDLLPTGADLITLVRVLFDHPDETVIPLLAAVRTAISDDGALLIAEPMARETAADRIPDAYFSFYLLAMGEGRIRTVERHTELLQNAGFTKVRRIPSRMPHIVGLIEARP